MSKKSFTTHSGILLQLPSVADGFNAGRRFGPSSSSARICTSIFSNFFLKAKTSVWIASTKRDVRDLGSVQHNLEIAHLVFHL